MRILPVLVLALLILGRTSETTSDTISEHMACEGKGPVVVVFASEEGATLQASALRHMAEAYREDLGKAAARLEKVVMTMKTTTPTPLSLHPSASSPRSLVPSPSPNSRHLDPHLDPT